MEQQFAAIVAKRTNAELIKILNSPAGDNQSVALEAAAQAEYISRRLSEDDIIQATTDIKQREQRIEDIANEALGNGWKIFALFFPGLLVLIFSGSWKADGYHRKAKELFNWTVYGWVMYLSFIIIVNLLSNL